VQGDLVICLDEARRQARVFGTTWQAEVVRYLVHGLLHLRGHDDLEPDARRRMKRVEDRIVRRLAAGFDFKRLGKGANVRA
jgi:probable rRNA maturation factor